MPRTYPLMGYRDARAAIEWRCRAFGFHKHVIHDGPDGRASHAEPTLGAGAIVTQGSTQHHTLSPRGALDIGAVAGGISVAVEDLDAHDERAKAAGAQIVQELTDDGYGRRYSAHDLEGHLWGFGNHRPSDEEVDGPHGRSRLPRSSPTRLDGHSAPTAAPRGVGRRHRVERFTDRASGGA